MRKFGIILLTFFLLIKTAVAQSDYSNTQQHLSIYKFIEQVESKYKVAFFYDDKLLGGIMVTVININGDLDSLLNKALLQTTLKFYNYSNQYIILTNIEELDLSEKYQKDKLIATEPDSISQLTDDEQNEFKITRIGTPGNSSKLSHISGIVKDKDTGLPIEGVSVLANGGIIGTTTDKNGFFKIHLPNGYHELRFRHIGMTALSRKVELYSSGSLNVSMTQATAYIDEVKIIASDERRKKEVIGFEKLKAIEMIDMPSFMGEHDIFKYSLLLPGIQSIGEMDMSFSVRGGKGDQNLILIDDMHTYSSSHFFGLFPGINPDMVESANIYKASIPIEYGNRLSSVYNVLINAGNQEKLEFEGGISPISANLSLNGPLIQKKLTVNAGFRSTYSNWLLNAFDVKELEKSEAKFYDYNIKLKYNLSEKSNLALFFTNSYDDFVLHGDSTFQFQNAIGSIKMTNYTNNNLTLESMVGFSRFLNQRIQVPSREKSSINKHSLTDIKLGSKIKYNINEKNLITSGLEFVYQQLNPWNIERENKESLVNTFNPETDKALNAALFLGDQYNILPNLSIEAGIRLSSFFLFGSKTEYLYHNNQITSDNIYDTIVNSEPINYFDYGPEIRISGNYKIKSNQNINFGYSRNRQYIHTLTNTQSITPISSWQLSNKYIAPQIGDHYTIGYNISLKKDTYFASVDVYYKNTKNIKDFINGSNFDFNTHPETEIVNAKGESYGVELLLKKNIGRFSGWLSYTYSRSFIKSSSSIDEKNINDGNYYPANNDKPHDLSLVINLEPTRRITLSSVINFSSGTPITLPISKANLGNNTVIIYSDRNQYRMPDYFRWDLSINFKGSLKRNKWIKSTWSISVYNVTGRNNVYSIYFVNQNNSINGYKLSIFGEPIPTITYKFLF